MHYAPGITDGSTPPLVENDHLIPWDSSIHLDPGDCWLEIESRGLKAKLMVTTSVLEIEGCLGCEKIS